MAEAAQSLTPRSLQSDYPLQEAFIAWFRTTSYVGDPVLMVEKAYVNAKVWQQFLNAQALASKGSAPQPKLKPGITAIEGEIWSEHGVKEGTADAARVEKLLEAKVKEVTEHPNRYCTSCHRDAARCLCAKSQPQPTPPPAVKPHPKPQPAPVAQPTPAPSTPATSSNPLIALIADGLRDMGFSPERSVTAEQAQSLADEAALSMAETVLAQLRADLENGKYRSIQRVEIVLNGKPIREIEGKAPVWFGRLLKLCQCRVPALLVGPAGCGKTTAAHMVAKALDLPFTRVSLSAGVDEGAIQGWLLPVEANGTFSYVPSALVHAYEHGGVVLLDELDAADANMLIILSAVLDNGEWHIPLRLTNPVLNKHADFVVIAAANTFGHGADKRFVGASQLDERTLSRFRLGQIACDYDANLETDLFSADVVMFGHRLRTRCRALSGWTRDVSTRDIETAHALTAAFRPDECWYGYFADWDEEECTRVHASIDHNAQTVTLN